MFIKSSKVPVIEVQPNGIRCMSLESALISTCATH
jgi:hypothetical protein